MNKQRFGHAIDTTTELLKLNQESREHFAELQQLMGEPLTPDQAHRVKKMLGRAENMQTRTNQHLERLLAVVTLLKKES